ncbi:HAD family hydrolase [soil metagenome]
MPSVLFGSISTLADTSELQRQSFNEAFAEHGTGWTWERAEYAALLASSGGQDRVAEYAASRGESVDAAAVHATKSRLFQEKLGQGGLTPRPGVVETIAAAKAQGMTVGLVTTTSGANVAGLLAALEPHVGAGTFDVVVDADSVAAAKPAPDAYTYAVAELAEAAGGCVAIEDNVGGVQAAGAAGLTCIAFPNANTAGHDFTPARAVVAALDPTEVLGLATSS